MLSNLSFLNSDVFIKFNRHEYMENDYLKKKHHHSKVAKDKSSGTAGSGPPQGSHPPSSLPPSWCQSFREAQIHGKCHHAALAWTQPARLVFLALLTPEVRFLEMYTSSGRDRRLGILGRGLDKRWMWGSTTEVCNPWKPLPLNVYWDLGLLLWTELCPPKAHMLKP